jgi:hypothetical protein
VEVKHPPCATSQLLSAVKRQFDLVVCTIRLQFSEQGSFFPEKLQVQFNPVAALHNVNLYGRISVETL